MSKTQGNPSHGAKSPRHIAVSGLNGALYAAVESFTPAKAWHNLRHPVSDMHAGGSEKQDGERNIS